MNEQVDEEPDGPTQTVKKVHEPIPSTTTKRRRNRTAESIIAENAIPPRDNYRFFAGNYRFRGGLVHAEFACLDQFVRSIAVQRIGRASLA